MSIPLKLTKKQRKSLAFREKKGKGKATDVDDEARDIPILENLDDFEKVHNPIASNALSDVRVQSTSTFRKGKEKVHEEGSEQKNVGEAREQSKKRKRSQQEAEDANDVGRNFLKPKKLKGAPESQDEWNEGIKSEGGKKGKNEKKDRYILFAGNLRYTTTKDSIGNHFAVCDPPPQVRLLTPKATTKTTSKSKGCAFLEFSHKNALQQALKLHQSELDGRKINVELTAGGGGKSEARLQKVKERNKGLATQRVKRNQLQSGAEKGAEIERPQRHSSTSGVDEMPLNKRTWSVGEAQDGKTHRGGKKHDKKRGSKRKSKDWGTGVNAIPVG